MIPPPFALLTMEQDKFCESMHLLTLAILPQLQDRVAVVGYSVGSDTISILDGECVKD
jgi:hypothetical protein